MTVGHDTRERPRPRRQAKPWPRRLLVTLAALVVFILGIALGKALDDGPPPPSTITYVRTLTPLPQQPATSGP